MSSVAVTKPEKFSYSKLEQYNQCGFAYYLKYVLGNYFFEANVATSFGSLVHKMFERITEYLKDGQEVPYDELLYDFENINMPKRSRFDRDGDIFGTKKLSAMYQKDWYTFSEKSGMCYATKAKAFKERGIYTFEEYCKAHPELEIIGAEIPFSFNYRGYVFSGYIDRLLREKGKKESEAKYVIMDIKTKDTPYDQKDLTTPLQFVVYTKAIYEMYGDTAQVECLYDLPIIDLRREAGTKGYFARGMKKIDKILDSIEERDWTPHPSALCYWCAFGNLNPNEPQMAKGKCPYYSLWTPNNKTFDKKFEWEGLENHEAVLEKYRKQMEFEEGVSIGKDEFFGITF